MGESIAIPLSGCLPYTYNTKNSQEIANELKRMQIDKQMKVITLDTKDLFVNLPIQGILTTTKFWLNRNIHDNELIKENLYILEIIMKQNYFQYNGRFLQQIIPITEQQIGAINPLYELANTTNILPPNP